MRNRTIEDSPSGRPKRTPVGTRNKLTVQGKDPNYVYRIVNDVGDRIQQFIDAGYEIVEAKDVRVGDKRVETASSEGSQAQVSVGGTTKAFVMRQKKEWYDEDQAAKQAQVKELEKSMLDSARNGHYGTLDQRSSISRESQT